MVLPGHRIIGLQVTVSHSSTPLCIWYDSTATEELQYWKHWTEKKWEEIGFKRHRKKTTAPDYWGQSLFSVQVSHTVLSSFVFGNDVEEACDKILECPYGFSPLLPLVSETCNHWWKNREFTSTQDSSSFHLQVVRKCERHGTQTSHKVVYAEVSLEGASTKQ